MEDSTNGKEDEPKQVAVKTTEVVNGDCDPEPESKRDTSILQEIVEKVEEIFNSDESSSSDEEKAEHEHEPESKRDISILEEIVENTEEILNVNESSSFEEKKIELEPESESKTDISILEETIDKEEEVLNCDESSRAEPELEPNDDKSSSSNEEIAEPEPELESKRDISFLNEIVDNAEEVFNCDESSIVEPEPENKKDIFIIEEIVDKAQEILNSNESSRAEPEPEPEVKEKESETNEKVEPSSVENFGTNATPSMVEQASEAGPKEAYKGIEENTARTHIPNVVPVSKDSLRATPWTNCCGLFEVLRRSER